jgi:hypothetical protein
MRKIGLDQDHAVDVSLSDPFYETHRISLVGRDPFN